MYKALFVSPMIPSYDLSITADFFKNVLNFLTIIDSPEYKVYKKDDLTVHLLPAGHDVGQMEFYMEVDDIDGVWNSIKDKISDLRVREPFDREYGMRELHIEIPKTNTLLFIGQQI